MVRKAYTGPHQITLPAWISPATFEKLLAMEILEKVTRSLETKTVYSGDGSQHAK
jgi:hypothetical protein